LRSLLVLIVQDDNADWIGNGNSTHTPTRNRNEEQRNEPRPTGNQLAFQSRINLARFYDADHKAKRTGLKQQHWPHHDHVSGIFPLYFS